MRETSRRKNRPGTRYLAQMLQLQASLSIELGRYREGQRLLDEADVIMKKANSPTSYMAVDERARLMIATDQANEAETALSVFHPVVPPPGALALDSLRLEVLRAEIALARGDAETARKLSAQAIQQLSASAARDYLKALEVRASLVQGRADLLHRRPSEALPLLQRAVELRQSTADPLSPVLALAQIGLAECYLDLGDPEKATVLLSAAKKVMASHRELSSQYLRPLQDLEQRLRQGPSLEKQG
jgi:eukaryotic-like serine/threonine-protein kinase